MDEDEEAQPNVRGGGLLPLGRSDLGLLEPRLAQEILVQYDPLVRGFVRRFPARLLGARFDEDDLYSLGRVLLLQFWVLYDPARDEGRGSFQGWATFLFRQAFAKVSKGLYRSPEIPCDFEALHSHPHVVGPWEAWITLHLTADSDPQGEVEKRQQVELYERALAHLPPREQFVLRGIQEGRTTGQIGADLALTRQRVDQIRVRAMQALRKHLVLLHEQPEDEPEDGLEDEATQDGANSPGWAAEATLQVA